MNKKSYTFIFRELKEKNAKQLICYFLKILSLECMYCMRTMHNLSVQ